MRLIVLLVLLTAARYLSQDGRTGLSGSPLQPDVVIFVLDDVADSDVDAIPTPSIDALAARGVRLRRAYAQDWCAPTRDSLMRALTLGEYLGDACQPSPDWGGLGWTMAKAFHGRGYRTCHVGKWHLGSNDAEPWYLTAERWGFDDVRMERPVGTGCAPPGQAPVVNDGVVSQQGGDDSIRSRDAALAWWAEREGRGPRFLMVNLAAGHAPFQYPPPSILPPGYPRPSPGTNRQRYEAEVVGGDFVIGQMIAAMPGAIVVVIGDNGTPGFVPGDSTGEQDATRPDQDPRRVKLSCYEDGIRVPFIIAGPQVGRGVESSELFHLADLGPTLLGLARRSRTVGGGSPAWPDGGTRGLDQSAILTGAPHAPRGMLYVHGGSDRPESAVVGPRYKLLVDDLGVERMFDLSVDPLELAPLPAVGPDADEMRQYRIGVAGR